MNVIQNAARVPWRHASAALASAHPTGGGGGVLPGGDAAPRRAVCHWSCPVSPAIWLHNFISISEVSIIFSMHAASMRRSQT